MAKTPSAGSLDRRITIERATTTTNSFNEPEPTWVALATVWAMRKDISDGEKFASGQVGSTLLSRFTIRSSTLTRTVSPVDRLSYGTTNDSPPVPTIWNILGVKEADAGRFRFLEITAVKATD